MKIRHKSFIALIVGLLLGALVASTAYATPPLQDPRPSDGGGSGGASGNGGDNGGGSSGSQPTGPTCASLRGGVFNWGVGPISGIGTTLKTGSWQVSASSASDGNYAFGGLGIGVARLQVTVPPELSSSLQPLAQDAGVYLNCEHPVVANIALFSGQRPDPPANIQMSAPNGLTPGENTIIRLLVTNDLPTEISSVIVTSLMPNGLTALEAQVAANSMADVKLIDGGPDGQLVYIYLGNMAPGTMENILLTVTADEALTTGAQIKTTATLFYQESAADQDSIDFTVGTNGLPLPAAIPTVVPTVTATPIATATAAITTTPVATVAATPLVTTTAENTVSTPESEEGAEDFVPPGGLPTTGDSFLPPPVLLPETGQDMDMTAKIPTILPDSTRLSPFLPLSNPGGDNIRPCFLTPAHQIPVQKE